MVQKSQPSALNGSKWTWELSNQLRLIISKKKGLEQHRVWQYDNRHACASKHLQNLWAIVEEAKSCQTGATVGRFEVGGSYDINYLAYS
ncbi:NICN1 [Cordylochernes scorpioides]|uniref:NICN1 n=1 Tax=Cordylochernes scorpioides TaxID=51811 RepID=A0ABY6KHB7_9ARAC|nr:NICN1 [Cordylochernes scorpioides]